MGERGGRERRRGVEMEEEAEGRAKGAFAFQLKAIDGVGGDAFAPLDACELKVGWSA